MAGDDLSMSTTPQSEAAEQPVAAQHGGQTSTDQESAVPPPETSPNPSTAQDQVSTGASLGPWTEVQSRAKPDKRAEVEKITNLIEKFCRGGSAIDSPYITKMITMLERDMCDRRDNILVVTSALLNVWTAQAPVASTKAEVRYYQPESLFTVNPEPPTLGSENVMRFVDAAVKWLGRITSKTTKNRELLDEALSRLVRVNQPELDRLKVSYLGSELLSLGMAMKPTNSNEEVISMVKKTMSAVLRHIGSRQIYAEIVSRRRNIRSAGESIVCAVAAEAKAVNNLKILAPEAKDTRLNVLEAYAILNLRATPYGGFIADDIESIIEAPDGPTTLAEFNSVVISPRIASFATLESAEKDYLATQEAYRTYHEDS